VTDGMAVFSLFSLYFKYLAKVFVFSK